MSDPPDWLAACQKAIAELGGTQCADDVCQQQPLMQLMWQVCTCQPPYENGCAGPNPPPDCCAYSRASPVPVMSADCYCCCGMAGELEIAGGQGEYRPIREYRPGDEVYVAEGPSLRAWRTEPVMWSAGVADGGAAMLEVRFAGDETRTETAVVVSRDQPFLTVDRDLVAAASLVAGRDALVTPAGAARPVASVRRAVPGRPLHHVATTTAPAMSPDGHLLVANGVVCGDWALHVARMT